jgi:lactate dehydrogenase-like 2-hydroxyacid dehydrogenase
MSGDVMQEIIVACPLPAESIQLLSSRFTVHYVPDPAGRNDIVEAVGSRIRGVVTNAASGWSAGLMDKMPLLAIICAIGVGYEGIDVEAARDRRISVTHGRGTNTAGVADHALALLFSVVRAVPLNDRAVRSGHWEAVRQSWPDISARRAGILGLGRIGLAIAQRLHGFDIEVAYHNRTPRSDVAFTYAADVHALARAADFLFVTTPGGPQTRHLVDGAVLHSLGPEGYLVNVGRGSVVDSGALGHALTERVIAGAAIDVFEEEPVLPPALRDAPNLVITPHTAGLSPRSERAYAQSILDNLSAKFEGARVLTPVPGSIDASIQ